MVLGYWGNGVLRWNWQSKVRSSEFGVGKKTAYYEIINPVNPFNQSVKSCLNPCNPC